jgi:hypothetical protein
MNFRVHSYIPLGWFVGRLKVIWANRTKAGSNMNLGKCLNQRYLLDGYLVFEITVWIFFKYQIKELPWCGLLKRVSGGYEPRARTVSVACDTEYLPQFSNKYPPKLQPGGFWCHLNNDPQNWCWITYPAIISLEAEHTKKPQRGVF